MISPAESVIGRFGTNTEAHQLRADRLRDACSSLVRRSSVVPGRESIGTGTVQRIAAQTV